MPLEHGKGDAAFKRNVGTLMGEVGKSPHVQSRDQALAIAYAVKRRGHADGGPAIAGLLHHDGLANFALGGSPAPWQVRSEARSMMHTGPINSIVPGRTDAHPMKVAPGSYVVNADTVSHLGQSNSAAGHSILSNMFGPSGPYGVGTNLGIKHGPGAPRPPKLMGMKAMGGASDAGGPRGDGNEGAPIDINAAGGEFVVPPEVVRNIGSGDIKRGHAILDVWMEKMRKDHIRTLKRLPGPAKS